MFKKFQGKISKLLEDMSANSVGGGAFGKSKDMEEELVEMLRLQKQVEEITLEQTGITAKKLERIYKAKKDWYMNSNEAIKLKVIDEIIL